jgi:hypothetical protein
MNAPAYKLAKMLVKLLQTHTPLPYTFNVTNSTHLINDLTDISYDHNMRISSFDISNMHINIPTHELLSIIDTACNNNIVVERLKRDIINLSKTIIDQNLFQFEDLTYKQNEGLAMGAQTSSIFSEFYLQHQENSRIYDLLRLQESFTHDMTNMLASLNQLNVQVQLPDTGNLFVSFMSNVDVTVVVTVLADFT